MLLCLGRGRLLSRRSRMVTAVVVASLWEVLWREVGSGMVLLSKAYVDASLLAGKVLECSAQ